MYYLCIVTCNLVSCLLVFQVVRIIPVEFGDNHVNEYRHYGCLIVYERSGHCLISFATWAKLQNLSLMRCEQPACIIGLSLSSIHYIAYCVDIKLVQSV